MKKSNPYHKVLLKRAEDLRASMSAQNAAHIVSRLDVPCDEGDLSQKSHEEWIFLNRNTLDAKLLREVDDAIRRIERDEYGVCQRCQEPISTKRLNAVPWAKYCVRCQELIGARAASGSQDDEDFD